MTDRRNRRLAQKLVSWFEENKRDLPWRKRRTPYTVWISEVMLQQTTAEVVSRRFARFLARFPDVRALARAPETDVLEEWSGLGYYRRARMLRDAARSCVADFGGRLPATFDELRTLPGIGDYTAGAIASMGFGARHPAVDGNVARVWSRFEATDGSPGELSELLLPWIPEGAAGPFNEALIELGATICRPVLPQCDACPIRSGCLAFQRGEVERYPAAAARKASVPVTSARGVLRDGAGGVLVLRRPRSASLLAGFEELPGRWLKPGEEPEAVLADVFSTLGFSRVAIGKRVSTARHVITHHRIRSVAFEVFASGAARPPAARFVPGDHLRGAKVTTETRKLADGAGLGE